jgi:hypothetical protein
VGEGDTADPGAKDHESSRRALGGHCCAILAPGVTPLPEELSVLSGGIAVIFSVIAPLQPQIIALADKLPSLQDTVNSTSTRSSWHSRMCRTSLRRRKNKAKFLFGMGDQNPRSIRLRRSVFALHTTLLQVLPVLINILIPNTFREYDKLEFVASTSLADQHAENVWNSPLKGLRIDRLLEEVSACAESVRVSGEGLRDDVIADNSRSIQAQLG